MDSSEWFEGSVSEWNQRGYGFVQLHDGRRAYVHVSAFGGGELTPGEVVRFTVTEDDQNIGKWKVSKLQRGSLGEDGVVAEWRRDGGFGFLTMDDGRRVYIHHSVFGKGDLSPGQRLRVLTKPDDRNPGKWAVSEVRGGLQEENMREARPMLIAATVAEWDKRGYGFVIADVDNRRVYVHHTSFGTGDLDIGERVSVNVGPDQRNPTKLMALSLVRDGARSAEFGVLASAGKGGVGVQRDFGGQAPLSFGVAEDVLSVMDSSAFSVPSANFEEELLLPSAHADLDDMSQEWSVGTVVEWIEEKGYGFIEVEDGRRLYVNHRAFGGGSLMQGVGCEVVITSDRVNPDKWMASAVRGPAVVERVSGDGEAAAKRQRLA